MLWMCASPSWELRSSSMNTVQPASARRCLRESTWWRKRSGLGVSRRSSESESITTRCGLLVSMVERSSRVSSSSSSSLAWKSVVFVLPASARSTSESSISSMPCSDQPCERATISSSRRVSESDTYRQRSPWRSPSRRNCMAMVVLPTPGVPSIRYRQARGRPPPQMSSRPGTPVPHLAALSSFTGGPLRKTNGPRCYYPRHCGITAPPCRGFPDLELEPFVGDHALHRRALHHAVLERGVVRKLRHRLAAARMPEVEHEGVGIEHRVVVGKPLAA